MDCHPAFTSVGQEEDDWPLAQGPALEKLAVSLSLVLGNIRCLQTLRLPLQSNLQDKTRPKVQMCYT